MLKDMAKAPICLSSASTCTDVAFETSCGFRPARLQGQVHRALTLPAVLFAEGSSSVGAAPERFAEVPSALPRIFEAAAMPPRRPAATCIGLSSKMLGHPDAALPVSHLQLTPSASRSSLIKTYSCPRNCAESLAEHLAASHFDLARNCN